MFRLVLLTHEPAVCAARDLDVGPLGIWIETGRRSFLFGAWCKNKALLEMFRFGCLEETVSP